MKWKNIGLIGSGVSLFYLMSIKPRIFNRPDDTPFRGKFFAHRGLHNMSPSLRDSGSSYYCKGGMFPENSFAAIERAVSYGFGVEFDVHLTKDDIPVVFHDDSLKRLCGVDGNLRDYTYAELKQFSLYGTSEHIPTFSSILKLIDGRVPIIIEYKVEKGNADRLCSICDKMLQHYQGDYCIESFHPKAVRWYKEHRPEVVRGQLSEHFTKTVKCTLPMFLLSHLIGNCYAAPDFIAYNCLHYKELSRMLCKYFYRSFSVAWTIRSKEQLQKISAFYDAYIFENFIPESINVSC